MTLGEGTSTQERGSRILSAAGPCSYLKQMRWRRDGICPVVWPAMPSGLGVGRGAWSWFEPFSKMALTMLAWATCTSGVPDY